MAKVPKAIKKQKPTKSFLKYSSLGFQLLGIILGFTYLGHYIDQKLDSNTPWFTILLSLVGVAGGLFLVLKDLLKEK